MVGDFIYQQRDEITRGGVMEPHAPVDVAVSLFFVMKI
jgi:hypothetical protein